ncbi:MAG: hypothetical protein HKN88_07380 [Gammaproteobacteria bacterium]|nr:hypothetical protein [Gammaproteobacteria bacterium]NNC97880.1 hypothetical protein [Gammaproteobacteria bacterium]NNM13551.1 hypothetical protein [Gammaproteobacteria bacterium]
MLYLILQMLFLLVMAVLIGLWVGWRLRGLEFSRRLGTLQNEWAGRFRSTDRERDIAVKKATTLDLKSRQLQQQLEVTGRLIKRFEESDRKAQEIIKNDLQKIEALTRVVNKLKLDLNKRDITLKKFKTLLATLQKLEREQKQKIRTGSSTIERLMQQAQQKTAQVNELAAELKDMETQQESAQELSTDIKQHYYELEAKLRDRETKLELIKSELEKQRKNTSSMEQELHLIQSQVSTAPANDLGLTPQVSNRPVWILEEPEGSKDNLQLIKGIGPVMERLLNEIGIFHYHQLARMNESDCLWVADRIRTFPKRIMRDRWQQQAVELDLDKMDQADFTLKNPTTKLAKGDI